MAVNKTEITDLYNTMADAVVARYTSMWNSNQIDAETYAKLVGEASSQFMQFAAELVQKQEQLDVQNRLTAQQVLNEAKQLELLDKQVDIAQQELLLKQKQIDVTEREMADKELTSAVQRQATQDEMVLKERQVVDQELTSIAQRLLLATDEQIKQYEVDYLQPAQLAQLQKQVDVMGREIADKEAISAKQRILLDTQEQAEQYKVDVLLPKEAEKLVKDIAAVDSSIKVQETKLADELLTSDKQRLVLAKDAAIKEYENVVLQPDQHATAIKQQGQIEAQTAAIISEKEIKEVQSTDELLTNARQRLDIDKSIELKEAQRKNVYVEMIGKDKEVAKMGLDNVVKNVEATRTTNPNAVYTPKYGV